MALKMCFYKIGENEYGPISFVNLMNMHAKNELGDKVLIRIDGDISKKTMYLGDMKKYLDSQINNNLSGSSNSDNPIPSKKSNKLISRFVILFIGIGIYIMVQENEGSQIVQEKLQGATEQQVQPELLAKEFNELTSQKRKEIQFSLTELGYYNGTIDGIWGGNTKSALIKYDLSRETNGSLRRIMNSLGREVSVPEYIGLDGFPPPLDNETGLIYIAEGYQEVAPFNISVSSDRSYYVKLRDASTSSDVMTIIIKKGETFRGKAPLGAFELVYASGNNWYGEELLFGPSTVYSRSNSSIVFSVEGNKINGKTLTLKQIRDGNMSTSSMGPGDF